MATNTFIPNYMDIDFDTMKLRLQSLLSKNNTFRDYNYEGANITLLIELVSYLSAMTTYYGNKIAQNQYIDTAELYETVHMLARLRGYNPKGYISAEATVTVTIADPSALGIEVGNSVKIPAWKKIGTGDDTISFATTTDTTETIPLTATITDPYTFDIYVKQGDVASYTYTGNDIIDNKLYLPNYNFDYDSGTSDEYPSIQMLVGNTEWTRLTDFYDVIDELSDVTTTYMFKYDKYQRYYIEFSSLRSVPEKTDVITINLLKSLGVYGNLAAGLITIPEDDFIYNVTKQTTTETEYLTVADNISVTNLTAAIGGDNPETISVIKESSLAATHSQYRNVSKYDYETFLEGRSDIVAAHVWGEQEVSPSGSFEEYNKVYISLIPYSWGESTISYYTSAGYDYPIAYSDTWKTTLARYMEPYKMISAWEEFILPEFVYFYYVIGIKVKRTYDFATVRADVYNKLIYYFSSVNRNFGEIISFTDVIDFILDPSYVSEIDDFDQVKGIQTLVIRDINLPLHTVYEPNDSGNYPYYTTEAIGGYENNLRHIQLGHTQFPFLDWTNCTFVEET